MFIFACFGLYAVLSIQNIEFYILAFEHICYVFYVSNASTGHKLISIDYMIQIQDPNSILILQSFLCKTR